MINSKFSDEWSDVCKLVKKGLEKVGHDIPLAGIECEPVIRETKANKVNEKYIRTGEMIAWRNCNGGQKERTGMVVSIIHKGESAMKCVPRHIKKRYAKFQDISKIDRVLIAVSDGAENNQIHYLCPPLKTVKTSIRRCKDVN